MSEIESTIVPQKQCRLCKNPYPDTPEYFHRNTLSKNGLLSRCKKCVRQQKRAARAKDPEGARRKARLWRHKNPDKSQQHYRTARERHGEKRNAQARNKRLQNPKAAREQDHRTYLRYKAKWPVYNQRRKDRIRGVTISDLTAAQWKLIKEHFKHRCYYCQRKLKRLTRDHIVPVLHGGNTTLSNIVPACVSCNSRKGAKPPPIPVQPLLL